MPERAAPETGSVRAPQLIDCSRLLLISRPHAGDARHGCVRARAMRRASSVAAANSSFEQYLAGRMVCARIGNGRVNVRQGIAVSYGQRNVAAPNGVPQVFEHIAATLG